MKLLRIRHLQQAGYIFSNNDLTYDEWLDLGDLKAALPSGPEQMMLTMMQAFFGAKR